MATSIGGQFRERLEAAASKAHWVLQIERSCTSFTQAARAVEAGAFGAVLPSVAVEEFKPGEVIRFPLPFLKSYALPICVAWNPRLAEVRAVVGRAVGDGEAKEECGGGGAGGREQPGDDLQQLSGAGRAAGCEGVVFHPALGQMVAARRRGRPDQVARRVRDAG